MDKSALKSKVPPRGFKYCDAPGTSCYYGDQDICKNCGRKKGWRQMLKRSTTMGRKPLVQYEADAMALKAIKESLHVIFNGKGNHRIEEHDVDGKIVAEGEWAVYISPCHFEKGGHKFFAVTDYYNGHFPVEKVLEWRE